MQPILDGSVLLIVAAFEQFVSDVMIAFAANVPDVVPSYDDLPTAIRSANERQTGEAISRYRSRFTYFELQRFVKNLGECQTGFSPYTLNGEALALNDRNLDAGTLRDLFSRLGIGDIWLSIASSHTLKRWSGPDGARVAGSRAKNQLNQMIQDRNQIAHRVGSSIPGPQEILSYMRFERALARSLVKALEDYSKQLQSDTGRRATRRSNMVR